MKINMFDWAEQVCSSDKKLALPIMTHPGIELTGKTVFDAVTTGEVHFNAINALNSSFPAIAATMIMDLTVEAEAFGAEVNFAQHEIPTIRHRLVSDYDSVEKLVVPECDKERISQYLLATKLAAQNITNKPVLAGCIGPMSLAGRLFDMTEIMTAMFIEPQTIHLLLKKCTSFILNYVNALKKCGANGLIIAEPAAGLLSAEMCDEFSSAYIKTIIDEVQDDSFMVFLHNCGNTGHLTQSMVSTGAKGLHFGNKIDMVKVLNEVPSNIIVLGNLDPVGIFKMSTPAEVEKSTLKLLNDTSEFKNFIISTGCDTPPNIPIQNIEAFYSAIDKFNSTKI